MKCWVHCPFFGGAHGPRWGYGAPPRQKMGIRHRIFANKFPKVLRAAFFSDIIVGFAFQKAWLSAQSEARRVVRSVNDGSKTDFSVLASKLVRKKYKLGTKK